MNVPPTMPIMPIILEEKDAAHLRTLKRKISIT